MPKYTEAPHTGTVMTVKQFFRDCDNRFLIDDDGYGCPMRDGKVAKDTIIKPSTAVRDIPADATHIEWYNR